MCLIVRSVSSIYYPISSIVIYLIPSKGIEFYFPTEFRSAQYTTAALNFILSNPSPKQYPFTDSAA